MAHRPESPRQAVRDFLDELRMLAVERERKRRRNRIAFYRHFRNVRSRMDEMADSNPETSAAENARLAAEEARRMMDSNWQ